MEGYEKGVKLGDVDGLLAKLHLPHLRQVSPIQYCEEIVMQCLDMMFEQDLYTMFDDLPSSPPAGAGESIEQLLAYTVQEHRYAEFMAAASRWFRDRRRRPAILYPRVLTVMSGTCTSASCEPEHACCRDNLLQKMKRIGWATKSSKGWRLPTPEKQPRDNGSGDSSAEDGAKTPRKKKPAAKETPVPKKKARSQKRKPKGKSNKEAEDSKRQRGAKSDEEKKAQQKQKQKVTTGKTRRNGGSKRKRGANDEEATGRVRDRARQHGSKPASTGLVNSDPTFKDGLKWVCALNALLQGMFPAFHAWADDFDPEPPTTATALATLFRRMDGSTRIRDARPLLRVINDARGTLPPFTEGKQHDAQEVYSVMSQLICGDTSALAQNFSDLVLLRRLTQYKCLSCNRCTGWRETTLLRPPSTWPSLRKGTCEYRHCCSNVRENEARPSDDVQVQGGVCESPGQPAGKEER